MRSKDGGSRAAAAIIVAGGTGSRMGRPKQFLPLAGKTVVEWSLDAFLSVPEIGRVVLVLSPESIKAHGRRLASKRVRVVPSGATRMLSVKNGVRALPRGAEVVAIHDGARPLVPPGVIRAALSEARRSGAAVAAVPVKDTLKKSGGKARWVSGTPPRSAFWQAQTPQCYRKDVLLRALARFSKDNEATDESQLVERAGHRVKLVPSSYENIKITTPEDLIMAEALMDARRGGRSRFTGFGYDIHRLVPGRALWLAGIRVPHSKGLVGHSDADAVLHALSDAILGALGGGEIGVAFPPTDPKFRGIKSLRILEHVLAKVRAAGGAVEHADVTLVAEEPKLKPRYAAMKSSLCRALGLPSARVNVKAKSHEGLGPVGRGEAIACHAVATVTLPGD